MLPAVLAETRITAAVGGKFKDLMNAEIGQWLLVLASGILLLWVSPWAKTPDGFFRAAVSSKKLPGFWMLTSSLVISWIFAKSITNAANLGRDFGLVGGVAYGVYYGSFVVAGLVLYRIRTKGGFTSLHHYLSSRFGRVAVGIFSVLIGFRLFNEVWSNTMVIGSYFGETGSESYLIAILVFTGLTLAYSLKGGLRSSLLTDAIQMVLFGVLLFVILGVILPERGGDLTPMVTSGEWTLAGGVNLLLVALLQIFSYPFHDPVLTDRAFIAEAKTTRNSFFAAAGIGFVCVVLFSLVGVHARLEGLEGPAPVAVSQSLGVGMMLLMNFIMITSAASTLDSTFNSGAKLVAVDLSPIKAFTVKRGRLIMVIVAVAGTLPIFFSPEILSATTVSGTMVMGLAPVFLAWRLKAPPLSFYLSVGTGVACGIVLTTFGVPDSLLLSSGKYADLLAINFYGLIGCTLGFLIPWWVYPKQSE